MTGRSCWRFVKKQLPIASVFLCLLVGGGTTSSQAQAYFHLQVESDTPVVAYQYFLRLEPDGGASLRMAYTAEGKDVLAEVLLADSVTSGSSRFLVPQTSPRFIKGIPAVPPPLPCLQFEPRTDSTGLYYEPTAVYFVQNGNLLPATLVTAQQKTFEELVQEKARVLQFYPVNDPFYLLLSGFSTRSLNTDEVKRRFYLILIANTNDPLIGTSSQKDLQGMTETFTVLTRQAGITLVPVVVAGDAFNIGNTRKVIDTIRPGPADIVLFYYSGHGFRYSNDNSKYPRISFRTNNLQVRANNNLAVEDVYNRLLAKGARVTIVISDCCNEKLGASVPFGMDLLRPRSTGTEGMKLNFDQFRKLFIPPQPTSIIIGSAAANQLAVGNPHMGGFFTNFFRAELIKSLYGNTGENSWLRIALNATENTRKQSLTAPCPHTPNVQGRCLQRAEVKVLPPL
ncbi:MAG TPA: caspase family protein [Lacibacter sp.]|nr:caspase family protein [Lacibacter sp.]HMO90194.1 caspase family protein [Lacibacter sp.]HMP86674.1 caspase family protein [Lacibacter sp.]